MCNGKVKLVLCLIKESRLVQRIGEWNAALATKKGPQVGLPLE
jgi:hypothetical protein